MVEGDVAINEAGESHGRCGETAVVAKQPGAGSGGAEAQVALQAIEDLGIDGVVELAGEKRGISPPLDLSTDSWDKSLVDNVFGCAPGCDQSAWTSE